MEINLSTTGSHKKKNLPLESLRGIAALCVALHHFQTLSPLTNNAFIAHSYLMVDFFFVLSGYVIALNYLYKIKNGSDLLSFQVRRFWRLYPLHFATLLLYAALELAKYVFQQYTGISPNDAPFEKNNLFAFINHIFMTHALFPAEATFNTRSWSISAEFYTYFLFGLILLLSRKKFAVVALVISIIGFATVFFLSPTIYVITRLAYFRCLYSFFLGTLIYIFSSKVSFKSNTPLLAFFFICAALGVTFAGRTRLEFLIPLVFGGLLLNMVSVDENSCIYKFLSRRWWVFLGSISYSVYLMHAFVWFCFRQIGRFVFGVEVTITPDDKAFVVFQPLSGTLITLAGLAIIIGISYITYTQIEIRFRKGIAFGRR